MVRTSRQMKKLLLISAATSLLATAAFAQTTVTTMTGAAGAAVQIEAAVSHQDQKLRHRTQDPPRDHEGDDRGWRPRAG
jgi:hypothetical protein